MPEWIPPLITVLIYAGLREAIAWLRFRKKDGAETRLHESEADEHKLDSQSNAVNISSTLLTGWMQLASSSTEKIMALTDRINQINDEKQDALDNVKRLEREKCDCEDKLKLAIEKLGGQE